MQLLQSPQDAYPDSSSLPFYPASYDTVDTLNGVDTWTHVPQEYLSDGGFEPVQGYYRHRSLELPLYETYRTDELCTPAAPLRDVNPNIAFHPQGTLPGPPISNQHYETVFYPVKVSPVMQTPAPTELGPSLPVAQPPQPAIRPLTRSHKYACGICPKTFDRLCRMENCRNRHSGAKPHQCRGRCGTAGCALRYSSVDYLERHINPTSLSAKALRNRICRDIEQLADDTNGYAGCIDGQC